MTPRASSSGIMKCVIVRHQEAFKATRYELYEEKSRKNGEDELLFLLAAKKQKIIPGPSNYICCLDRKDFSGTCVGRLTSNFWGTKFRFYDQEVPMVGSKKEKKEKKQLGGVLYETNLFGLKGPRKLSVIIPKPPKGSDKKTREKFLYFKNKMPEWNSKLGTYQVNFKGRVSVSSVKNFQLVYNDDESRSYNKHERGNIVVLQCGKIGEGRFTLDFQYPFSIFQAFCVALTAFDKKIACE